MIERPLYVSKIMKFADAPLVKILTGIRRSGKSTILKMIADEFRKQGVSESCIIQYRFDSMENEEIKDASSMYKKIKEQLVANKKNYLFLDEVQEVTGWEKAVNSFLADFNVDIYITGSNSRMMSSEISTYLTGRYISFRILPLSFNEYLSFRKSYTEPLSIHEEFFRYVKQGGFPSVNLREYSDDETYTVVRDIFNSVVFSDIVRRNEIRKIDMLERIIKFVFSNAGNQFSALSLAKFLKNEKRSVDVETVYNYLSKLESAYIIHKSQRYDIQGKEILKTQEKYYLDDVSLRYSLLGYSQDSVASSLENIVYLELLRRGYEVYTGKNNNVEIDFIGQKNNERIYIQVAQTIKNSETMEREYQNLLDIKDNYPKYVLTTDEFAGGNYNGIISKHIADWLLEEK